LTLANAATIDDDRDGRPSLTIRILPRPANATFARERLAAFCAEQHVPDDDCRTMMVAVGEALANALEHSRTDESIELRAVVGGLGLYVTVVDRGTGLDAVPTAIALPPPDAERGRGFPLMRRCADVFAVRTAPGTGTAVILGRHFRSSRSGGYASVGAA
jgi:anti-sigma regulatory factor (Ser/Thr protein kinase)